MADALAGRRGRLAFAVGAMAVSIGVLPHLPCCGWPGTGPGGRVHEAGGLAPQALALDAVAPRPAMAALALLPAMGVALALTLRFGAEHAGHSDPRTRCGLMANA